MWSDGEDSQEMRSDKSCLVVSDILTLSLEVYI